MRARAGASWPPPAPDPFHDLGMVSHLTERIALLRRQVRKTFHRDERFSSTGIKFIASNLVVPRLSCDIAPALALIGD